MEKATRAQLPPTGEARLTDGRWLRMSQSSTSDGGSIVVCSDISLLKQQEETLKGINLRLDAALDNMSQGLCLFDAENRLAGREPAVLRNVRPAAREAAAWHDVP